MSYGAYCKHCRHYATQHGENGRCEVQHPNWNNGAPCDCPGYEVEPGSDWSPGETLHVRVNTPALKHGR
jgi:hypothetical protein